MSTQVPYRFGLNLTKLNKKMLHRFNWCSIFYVPRGSRSSSKYEMSTMVEIIKNVYFYGHKTKCLL